MEKKLTERKHSCQCREKQPRRIDASLPRSAAATIPFTLSESLETRFVIPGVYPQPALEVNPAQAGELKGASRGKSEDLVVG
jgi:hypothetical protein